jgi:hypothetical protein
MNTRYASPFRRLAAYWIDITLLYALVFGLQFSFAALTAGVVANWLTDINNSYLIYAWIVLTTSSLAWRYFILLKSSPQ